MRKESDPYFFSSFLTKLASFKEIPEIQRLGEIIDNKSIIVPNIF
jgi:hypothetical protein